MRVRHGVRLAVTAATLVTLCLAGLGATAGAAPPSSSSPANHAAAASNPPGTVVVLVAGYLSTLSNTQTYDPFGTTTPSDLTQIETDFDPAGIDQQYPGTSGCSPTTDMTDSLQNAGALILPFSYEGVTVTTSGGQPSVQVTAYPSSDPSNVLPATAASLLDTEITGIHTTWPDAKVLVVGHSEGGLVAETWWANDFTPASYPEVSGVFSLDSPINGISNSQAIGQIFPGISPALLAIYTQTWNDRQSNDATLLAKETSDGGDYYVPYGTGGDGVYLVADKPGVGNGLASEAVGLESQVLLDSAGGPAQPPVMITQAVPPTVTHAVQVSRVKASHQCVMGNNGVIATITQRVTSPAVPLSPLAQPGYRMAATDGGVFTFGDAGYFGSHGGAPLNQPIVGMAPTPDGQGYWLVAADGGVFAYGDAGYFGSHGSAPLNQPIVGMAPTPDGQGYWLVAADGGVFAYGDATYYGSHGGSPLNKPIVGIAATPDGAGYWLVAADGGIFTYGDATYYGSHGGSPLNKPIVGIAATPDGAGYWLVAADGGIFTYGDATYYGSHGGSPLNKPIVGIAATPDGAGYWLVAADGGIFTYGDATYEGSEGGTTLNAPIVGATAAD